MKKPKKKDAVMILAVITLKNMIVEKLNELNWQGNDSEIANEINDLFRMFDLLNEELEEDGYAPIKFPSIPEHPELYKELLEKMGIDKNLFSSTKTKEEVIEKERKI